MGIPKERRAAVLVMLALTVGSSLSCIWHNAAIEWTIVAVGGIATGMVAFWGTSKKAVPGKGR